MPRITESEKARNRSRILEAAGRSFRTRGVDSVAVADLMNAAGMTHGGFYNHFSSKESLVEEVLEETFADALRQLTELGSAQDPATLAGYVDSYLSVDHRDADDGGCPSSSLATDASRHGGGVQRAYARGIEALVAQFATALRQSARAAD